MKIEVTNRVFSTIENNRNKYLGIQLEGVLSTSQPPKSFIGTGLLGHILFVLSIAVICQMAIVVHYVEG